jgi:hypothetical protein
MVVENARGPGPNPTQPNTAANIEKKHAASSFAQREVGLP